MKGFGKLRHQQGRRSPQPKYCTLPVLSALAVQQQPSGLIAGKTRQWPAAFLQRALL